MGALIAIGIKGSNGKYYNYTISVNDTPDQYGNNVAMWVEQTQDEKNNKSPKQYVGNGKVFWTDGKINTGGKKVDSAISIPDIIGMTNNNPVNNSNQAIPQNTITQQNNTHQNQSSQGDDFYTNETDDLPF
jgi:hypothetical protein